MIKNLKKQTLDLYHIIDGARIPGPHSGIWDDVSGLSGDVSGISGNVSGIWGDVSGIRGNVAGIRGNLDTCGITAADRAAGIDVSTLVD